LGYVQRWNSQMTRRRLDPCQVILRCCDCRRRVSLYSIIIAWLASFPSR
jgi:hypothetical protein